MKIRLDMIDSDNHSTDDVLYKLEDLLDDNVDLTYVFKLDSELVLLLCKEIRVSESEGIYKVELFSLKDFRNICSFASIHNYRDADTDFMNYMTTKSLSFAEDGTYKMDLTIES